MFPRSLAGAPAASLIAIAIAVPLASQQTPTPSDATRQGYVIRETTHRVLVDVIVTDDHGKPVHGLKESDFSVAEDKKPQKILSFDVEDGEKPSFIRVAVRDLLTNRTGTLEVPLPLASEPAAPTASAGQ